MKTKIFLILIFTLIFLSAGLSVSVSKVLAQESSGLANIQYPIEELGNCEDKADCKTYCDEPKNTEDCFAFAEKNNLMSKEEIKVAEKFLSGNIKGPGGCKTKDACEEYCNDTSRIDECLSFAEKNDLIPPEELKEAKKVQAAIARGAKPPPCGNKKSCDVYCDDPEHMEECITFGIEAGFIQGKELEDVQKMLQAVKRGVKPPPCKGKKACDEYCSNPDNMEVCMNFAMEAGFMSEQEKADSQKMLTALKKGIRPPNCRGREECDVYCSTEEHFEECANFAEAAGFMTAEDAVMARKTKGKGPGNCRGKEECENFCNNPDNQETCFNFAKENGMIPEEDLKRMEEGKQQFQPGPGEINPGGQMMPQQAGPGGCKTPEECQSFCQNNPEQCKNLGPGPDNQQGPLPQGEPCQGENCQPPPQGQIPAVDQQPQQQFAPGTGPDQQPPSGQQPPSDGSVQPPPPPPPPPTSFLKPQSFLGAVLYVIAKALYSLR